MEKELGVKSGHYERAQMEKESMRDLLIQTREAESWEKRSPKSNTSMNSSFGELPSTESVGSLSLNLIIIFCQAWIPQD